jgi:hypothetical protein
LLAPVRPRVGADYAADRAHHAGAEAWHRDVIPGSPAEFGKFIADDTEKWANVVKFAGIKVE